MIRDVFRAEGLPLNLAYVPLIESAFKPSALSRASAPRHVAVHAGHGRRRGPAARLVSRPACQSRKGDARGREVPEDAAQEVRGDWHLALAAYNGGSGRVQRAYEESRLATSGQLMRGRRFLPRETRDYVPMILAAMVVARNPARYRLRDRPGGPAGRRGSRGRLPGPVDLRRVAEWTGVPVDDIRLLNPELRRWTTPVRADRLRRQGAARHRRHAA